MNFTKSIKQRYQEFFEKTGIQLTDEPLKRYPVEIEDEMDELFVMSHNKPLKAIPRLGQLLDKYPQVPAIKNFLYLCYRSTGKQDKANDMQERMLQEHPDYLFGIVPKILSLTKKEELEEYAHLLGEPRDIRTIMPNEKVYHIAAFTAYESAAAHYEAFTGNAESALKRLETLIELDVEQVKLDEVARNLATARILAMTERLNEDNRFRITVESFAKVAFDPTDEPPQLEYQELEILYTHSTKNIDKDAVARLIQLPREALIRDLERMLEDSIRRWKYFQGLDYDYDTHEFIFHALFFLGALKAEESLQKVLDLLRMGDDFTDFWFGDSLDFIMLPTLYELGKNQLEELKKFVLEPDLDDFNRLQASKVVAQVALHQPKRRAEVVQWFEDVFNYLLEHEDDDRLMDTNFIGFSVAEVINFKGLELLSKIEELWNKKLIPPSVSGNLKTIKEDLNEPHSDYYKEPLPLNIQEYYSGEYKQRKAPLPEKQLLKIEKIKNFMDSEAEFLVSQHWGDLMGFSKIKAKNKASSFSTHDENDDDTPYYIPPKQVKREAPKTGRNDPCPCGSGKKYKHCHGAA